MTRDTITSDEAAAVAAIVGEWVPYARAVCAALPGDPAADDVIDAALRDAERAEPRRPIGRRDR